MSVSGYIDLLDGSGEAIYTQFFVDSTETVRFQLDKVVDGTESNLDVSASNLSVEFRVSAVGSATFLGNTRLPLTKQLGTSTAGDTGIVQGDVAFRTADIGTGVECAVVVIDSNVADANTPSTNKETIWRGRWLADITKNLDDT